MTTRLISHPPEPVRPGVALPAGKDWTVVAGGGVLLVGVLLLMHLWVAVPDGWGLSGVLLLAACSLTLFFPSRGRPDREHVVGSVMVCLRAAAVLILPLLAAYVATNGFFRTANESLTAALKTDLERSPGAGAEVRDEVAALRRYAARAACWPQIDETESSTPLTVALAGARRLARPHAAEDAAPQSTPAELDFTANGGETIGQFACDLYREGGPANGYLFVLGPKTAVLSWWEPLANIATRRDAAGPTDGASRRSGEQVAVSGPTITTDFTNRQEAVLVDLAADPPAARLLGFSELVETLSVANWEKQNRDEPGDDHLTSYLPDPEADDRPPLLDPGEVAKLLYTMCGALEPEVGDDPEFLPLLRESPGPDLRAALTFGPLAELYSPGSLSHGTAPGTADGAQRKWVWTSVDPTVKPRVGGQASVLQSAEGAASSAFGAVKTASGTGETVGLLSASALLPTAPPPCWPACSAYAVVLNETDARRMRATAPGTERGEDGLPKDGPLSFLRDGAALPTFDDFTRHVNQRLFKTEAACAGGADRLTEVGLPPPPAPPADLPAAELELLPIYKRLLAAEPALLYRYVNGGVQWVTTLSLMCGLCLLTVRTAHVGRLLFARDGALPPGPTAGDRADAWAEEADSVYGLLGWFVWVMPSLGFVGTILGIGGALGFTDRVVAAETPGDLVSAIQQVTGRLSVAFDTTLVALACSIGYFLLLSLVRRVDDWGLARAARDAAAAGSPPRVTGPSGAARQPEGSA